MTTPVLRVVCIDLDDSGALDDVFPTSFDWSAPGHPGHSCGALHCETLDWPDGPPMCYERDVGPSAQSP